MKKWNTRSILINTKQKSLNILSQRSNNEKQLILEYYTVEYLGFQKEKKIYSFTLQTTQKLKDEKKLRYLQIELGDPDEAKAKEWYEVVKQVKEGPKLEEQVQKDQKEKSKQVKKSQLEATKNKGSYDDSCVQEEYTQTNERTLLARIKKPYETIGKRHHVCENIPKETYDKIHQLAAQAPQPFTGLIYEVLQDHFNIKNFEDLMSNEEQFVWVQEKNRLQIYQSKKNPKLYRAVFTCLNSPMQLFEEIQMPQDLHWHPMIIGYDVMPSSYQNTAVVRLTIVFKAKDGEKIERTVFYHRYGFEFEGVYYLFQKTFVNDFTEDTLENELLMVYRFFTDPQNPKSTYFVTDISFQFSGVYDEDLQQNKIKFLENMHYIDHDPAQVDDEMPKDVIITTFKEKRNELSSLENSIDVKYDNLKFFRQEPVQTWFDAESEFTKEEFAEILEMQKTGQHTVNTVSNYHDQGPGVQKENRLMTTKEKGNFAWQFNYERCKKNGGLIMVNEKLIKDQRNVLSNLIKRVGSNLLSGKSLMSISMPVTIFDRTSFLQRIAKSYGFAPHFLTLAGQQEDPVEQIKYITSFYMAHFIMNIKQEKPFNPILGETLEGRLNGYPIYCEQISHHPPIMSFIHYGPNYVFSGQNCPEVSMGANSLRGWQKANPVIEFKHQKRKFYVIQNGFTIFGVIIGQRLLNATDRSFVFEPESRIACELIYNPFDKGVIGNLFSNKKNKIDEVVGAIYKLKPAAIQKLMDASKFNLSKEKLIQLDPDNDIEQYISKASGVWNQFLKFDDQTYWDIDLHLPYVLEYEKNPLPSDSIFREDLLWLNIGDKEKAQESKEFLETRQRQDAKLRKEKSSK